MYHRSPNTRVFFGKFSQVPHPGGPEHLSIKPHRWPSLYAGYSIQLVGSGVRGITTDLTTYENPQTVAVLGPTADCSQTPWLKFENAPTSFYASVYFRNVDGTVGTLADHLADVDAFEVVIEVS